MARLDLTHAAASDSVFALAGKLAATAADREAIRNEQDLERLYHLRLAASRRRCGSSLDSLELRKMAGWS